MNWPSCPRTTVLSCQELGDPLLQPFHSSNRAQRDSVQRLMQPFALRTNSAGADNCVWHAVLPGAKCLSDCTWQHGMVVMINRIILARSSLRPRQTGWRWWQKPRRKLCPPCICDPMPQHGLPVSQPSLSFSLARFTFVILVVSAD